MAVTYKKLFHMLIEKDMTTTQLQQKAGFSSNIVPRMSSPRKSVVSSIAKLQPVGEKQTAIRSGGICLFRPSKLCRTLRSCN